MYSSPCPISILTRLEGSHPNRSWINVITFFFNVLCIRIVPDTKYGSLNNNTGKSTCLSPYHYFMLKPCFPSCLKKNFAIFLIQFVL